MESPPVTGSVIPQQNPPEEKENTPEVETLKASNVISVKNCEPSSSAKPSPEQKPADQEKNEEPKTANAQNNPKPSRRRSSMSVQLAKAFLNPDTEDIMSPVEFKLRPKRVTVRPPPPKPAPVVVKPAKPVQSRYSFDIGERVAVKSCLKPTKGPILIRPNRLAPPPPKSRTQQTARKILEKYRRSSGLSTKTPRRPTKLKFHNVCSIRVITPRPDYNPEKLNMCSESDEEADTSRQRLSTVVLQLTPTSQANLDDMRKSDVLQFNASMVFGDEDALSSGEDEAAETAIEDTAFVAETEEKEEEGEVEVKKRKPSRRKSVMLGAAAPLKSPAKIERARDDEVMEEPVEPEPSRATRKSRRSVRLNPDAIEKPEEPEVILHERDKEIKKKRDHVKDVVSVEPDPKRSRRKSGFIKLEKEVRLEKKVEKCNPLNSFFAPKQSKKEEKKIEETIQKERKRTRRSSAYFGTADVSRKSSSEDDVEIVEVPETEAPSTSSSASTLKLEEDLLSSPIPSKVASIFSKPSPLTSKKVSEIKQDTVLTATSSPSTSSVKLFSLFSPKPKPKIDPVIETVVDSVKESITLSDSPMTLNPKKTIGVRRKEHWGDLHPESYEFMLKMAPGESIFETETFDENLFKSRSVDIAKIESVKSELREIAWQDPSLLSADLSQKIAIKKMDIPETSSATAVFPSSMEHLVEGADQEDVIKGWLKRWKRRVRKEQEREMAKEKQKRSGGRRGRKGRDEYDDSDDEDFELGGIDDGLENPLVLIGPTGVGKTALIRALAKQSNMRIISIGPEEERSGAEIKKKLHEAIRSHRVDQQPDRGISLFYKTIPNSTLVPKEKTPAKKEFVQSLVVFEHVDVFFENLDRYGVNGLLDIVNDAAVPVVFTCEKDWPRSTLQVELTRPYLEIRMGRNEFKVQKYVQRLIYSTRNVFIDDDTIRQLSESVNHDLQSLIHQAHLFSLAATKPFPLTSRFLTSNGFEHDWEKPREAWTQREERMETLMEQYSDILPDGFVKIAHPKAEKLWDANRRELGNSQLKYRESVQNAFEALRGRQSRKNLVLDVLPLLIPIDRVERQKRARSRRYLHHFRKESELPIDGETLSDVVGCWSINRH